MEKKRRKSSEQLTQKYLESEFQKAVPLAKEKKRRVAICHEKRMYLAVLPSGIGTWRYKYGFGGRDNEISLFVEFPGKGSLTLAREKREEAKRLLKDGQDPSAIRQGKRAESEDTVIAIAEDWFATKQAVSDDTKTANRRRLEKFVYKALGRTPIRSIKPLQLLTVLRDIVEGEKNVETARRVRFLCSSIWKHAVLTGKADFNIAAGLNEAMATAEPRHFASITEPR